VKIQIRSAILGRPSLDADFIDVSAFVFAGLLNNSDFTSSHLFVVLCTGLAFFAVQLVLSVRFYVRTRRQERAIRALCRDREDGRDDSQDLQATTDRSGWLQWVTANFTADAAGTPCNFSRDDALQELSERIASNGDYLLLQRMGIMAPLLGVVLTVIGFYWLEIGEQEQSLRAILLAVAPLVSGVGTGAVLALINQALLHVAGHRAESLRSAARNWFDTTVWSRVGLNDRAATGRTIAALDDLSASISDASARYLHGIDHIHESTASMSSAASQFHDVVRSFGAEITDVPEALSEIRRATAASAEALEELIHVGSRAVANLDDSVTAFRATVDGEFAGAAKLQQRAGRIMARSAKMLDGATEQIRTSSHSFKQSAQASQLSVERLEESMRTHIFAGNQHFKDAIEELMGRVAAFSNEVRGLTGIVESVGGEFNQLTARFVPSVSALRETIDNRFATAVSQQSAHVEAVNRSMQQVQDAADGMAQGATTLNAMLHEMSQFVRQTRATHEMLAEAARNLSEVVHRLELEPEAQARAAAQHSSAMDEVSSSLIRFNKRLSEFVSSGLEPATERLAVLHDTLADFEDVVDSVNDFNEALANEQVGSPHAQADGSQQTFMNWLARRPR
jgi:methyl-accepting chemotaxis protein